MATRAHSIPLPAFLHCASLPASRFELQFYIEALIHLSEQLDGDPDLEADYIYTLSDGTDVGAVSDAEPPLALVGNRR